MAQLWVPGPCHFFVGPFNCQPGAANYLGTSDRKPEIEIRPFDEKAYADQGGSKVEHDSADEGQDALVSARFCRFNQLTMQAITTLPNASSAIAGTPTAPRGLYIPGDLGTLLMTEQQGITVFVVFPYAAKPFYGSGTTLMGGYRFPVCKLEMEKYTDLGPQAMLVPMAWHAQRYFDPAGSPNNYGVGSYLLFDYTVGNLSTQTN